MTQTYIVTDDTNTVKMIADLDIWAEDFKPPMEYTTSIGYTLINEGDIIPEIGQIWNGELNIWE
jgi:hypothetical protein